MNDADRTRHSGQAQMTDADISREAATWFARLLDDSATAQDRAEFRCWLEQDARHGKAYAELERLWLGAGIAPDLSGSKRLSRRKLLKTGGAAVILLGGGAGLVRYLENGPGDYRTATGETASIMLPDGSTAELSTSTAISVRFSADRRLVLLHEGEALFTVARDPARRFTVETGELQATALGTEFSVAIRPGETEVAVSRHAVRVSATASSVDVQEGQSVLFTDNRLMAPRNTDVETQLSWRDGKLVFISTPFEQVVETLSRWRSGKMMIMDRALAKRPVSLIIDVRRTGTILQTLENGLPIRVDTYSPWLALIYPRQDRK